jgi:L-serine dehydratase
MMKKASERISALDIFKIGIGPSSSHTMGPWRAALAFVSELETRNSLPAVQKIRIDLYGSLAKTGKGHGTDMALILGLSGCDPETIDPESIPRKVNSVKSSGRIYLNKNNDINFDTEKDINFNTTECLPYHPNGISLEAILDTQEKIKHTFYSIGGGFIVCHDLQIDGKNTYDFPYPIDSAEDLLQWTRSTGKSVTEIVTNNELSIYSEKILAEALDKIWETMADCMFKGCHTKGLLPGGLNVKRRANTINEHLLPDGRSANFNEWFAQIHSRKFSFNEILKWISCFAIAVNEENAAYGRIVTAPTNGAAGVIPAVLMYYLCFEENATKDDVFKFLLTAAEIGSIFKKGSTISAAMGGCQAEIGVSSAMAAAALTECLGGVPEQVVMAAEIAMEHHLGLTCDPVGGLVQIPCIERNSMGSIKAITAAYLALEGDPVSAKVSLDEVIKTMWDTAQDMNAKYKETSEAGLAINIPVNMADC